jgi:hypothetical protein
MHIYQDEKTLKWPNKNNIKEQDVEKGSAKDDLTEKYACC